MVSRSLIKKIALICLVGMLDATLPLLQSGSFHASFPHRSHGVGKRRVKVNPAVKYFLKSYLATQMSRIRTYYVEELNKDEQACNCVRFVMIRIKKKKSCLQQFQTN